jgi:hypothetical protein
MMDAEAQRCSVALENLAERRDRDILDEAGKKGAQKVDERTRHSPEEFGGIKDQYRNRLADKVQSVIQSLEASKSPGFLLRSGRSRNLG